MLVQALDLGEGALDFDIDLGHVLAELLMVCFDPLTHGFEHFCRSTAISSASITSGYILHQFEVLDLLAELRVQVADASLDLLDLFPVFFGVGGCFTVVSF